MNFSGYFPSLLAGARRGIVDRLLLLFLCLLAVPYGAVMRLRALAYSRGWFTVRHLHQPVVSVGNITVGGTGKTPTVIAVARMLMARGRRVAVLSRGYGGTLEGQVHIVSDGTAVFLSAREAGDEPVLLAKTVPGLMVVIGADRYAAGLLAEEKLAPDVFILDDGFQHLRLYRDLNILLLDCSAPLGSGKVLPAGLLREPIAALRRADVVIYTRCQGTGLPTVHGTVPVCRSVHSLVGVRSLAGGELLPWEHLQGHKGFAFAGIADPSSFFHALREQGVTIVAQMPLADHCCYDDRLFAQLALAYRESGADYLITTEKDTVKLLPQIQEIGAVYATVMELVLLNPEPLDQALATVLGHGSKGAHR
jgi:tetraacyldisaccharide 4'-kinase